MGIEIKTPNGKSFGMIDREDGEDFVVVNNKKVALVLENEGSLIVRYFGKYKKESNLPIFVDETNKKWKIPEITECTEVVIPTETFKDAIAELMTLKAKESPNISFILEKGKFSLMSELDQRWMKIDTEVSLDAGDIKNKYNSCYLEPYFQLVGIAPNVKIKLKTNYPLMMEFVCLNKFSVVSVVAPIVVNE